MIKTKFLVKARLILLSIICGAGGALAQASDPAVPLNLLLNPRMEFHAFAPYRKGLAKSYTSRSVAFWQTDQWGDITVTRESVVKPQYRPDTTVGNIVSIGKGRRFWQFFTLPEAQLAHGDKLSLVVGAYQAVPGAVTARIKIMKLDSEDGTWSPSDVGLQDERVFPRFARGELVVHKTYEAKSDKKGHIVLRIDNAVIEGDFVPESKESSSKRINTIGVAVEFENTSAGNQRVMVYNPCLVKGKGAEFNLPCLRSMIPWYTHLPRTIQKLWKGEAIHILVMGSSIDRGSANPAMVIYDENPESPTFKQPLSREGLDGRRVNFEPEKVGREDLKEYVGWAQHYYGYAGRLRTELMRRFDLPASKICVNFMALDGASVGESFPGLKHFCELSGSPNPWMNGNSYFGTSWHDIHPELLERPEGPGPDLVIFGSGANRKTDTPNEVAVFEGVIRWIQRRYAHTEFLFSLFQNQGGYTSNQGDLQALSLRYQIPMLDYAKTGCEVTRWCNKYTFVPPDGHPQAVAHYIWYREIAKAFQCWDPVLPGIQQLYHPERVHANAYGWEGDAITFEGDNPRIEGNLFVFEDTALNAWVRFKEGGAWVDGVKVARVNGRNATRTLRKSGVAIGDLRLGDRHILEIAEASKFNAVDSIICPNRRFHGVDSGAWNLGRAKVRNFKSTVGAPYGDKQIIVPAGSSVRVNAVGSDLSIAYIDAKDGGLLKATVDGVERLTVKTDQSFVTNDKKERYLENRKGILGLGYGWHDVTIEASESPVRVLGLFSYDSRPNRNNERVIRGFARGGETMRLAPTFLTRPLVICSGDLKCDIEDVTPSSVKFSGGEGAYQIVGGGDRVHTKFKIDWYSYMKKKDHKAPEVEWKEVFSDTFERDELGNDYEVVDGEWKVADGKLQCLSMEKGNVLKLKGADFSGDFRIEIECRTTKSFAKSGACDMSFFFNMPEEVDYKKGFFVMFGSRQNRVSGIKKEGNTLVLTDDVVIAPGKVQKVLIQRVGPEWLMKVDGKTVFAGKEGEYAKSPKDKVGLLYVMRGIADYDNLKVYVPE